MVEKLFCLNTGKGQIRTAVDCGALAGYTLTLSSFFRPGNSWNMLHIYPLPGFKNYKCYIYVDNLSECYQMSLHLRKS